MDKEHVIAEIQRTAWGNGGTALGWRRFESETGIRYYDWCGRFWTTWGDAVREAGLEPNRMSEAYDDQFLLEKLVFLMRRLQRVPVAGDLLLAPRSDPTFPTEKVFRRLGPKRERVSRVIAFCEANLGYEDVAALWKRVPVAARPSAPGAPAVPVAVGYVYLLKHGSRREYKIGRTNNPVRREGEMALQLPEQVEPLHYIKTDDPAGVESYWHTRFAGKREEVEWCSLTEADVQAFKRWKRIH